MAQIPPKRTLLTELAPLTHSQRMRHMSLLGRDHAGTADLRTLLDSLDDGLYEWQLRLAAAKAARDPLDVTAGMDHPLRSVRSLATNALRLVEVDRSVLRDALMAAGAADRRPGIAAISSLNDTELADELIEPVFDRFGAREAVGLLPTCSAPTVDAWLPRVSHSVTHWSTIARRHSSVFVAFFSAMMDEGRVTRPAWWSILRTGVAALVRHDPDVVLDLWDTWCEVDEIPYPIAADIRRLMSARPERTLAALLRPERRSRAAHFVPEMRRHLPKASDEQLIDLTKALLDGHERQLPVAFSRLAPSRRGRIFLAATEGMDHTATQWSKPLLAVLPHDVRAAETSRMLQIPRVAEDDDARHELLTLRPLDETWDELLAATHASEANRRARAYSRLIAAVIHNRDPDYFDRLLDELQRMKNEQDPVRQIVHGALAHCPTHLVTVAHMEHLHSLARFVVEARDANLQSATALVRLFQRLILNSTRESERERLRSSIDGLKILVGQRGSVPLGPLDPALAKDGEQILFAALRENIESEIRAGRYGLLFSISHDLGRRAYNVDGLQELLGAATQASDTQVAIKAIRKWVDVPGKRSERLEELVRDDASTVHVAPVFALISRYRQDLLDIALDPGRRRGRFERSAGQSMTLVTTGFHRWHPRQWSRYAELVQGVISSEETSIGRASGLRTLSRIPEVDPAIIGGFVASDDVVLAEAALGGLAWGEAPGDHLPTLVAYAGTDRARVAMYAAARAARFATPQQVDKTLRDLLLDDSAKLTSRKSALRILGDTRPPGALATLAEVWSRRPLHRNVLIAVASAMRAFPDEPLTWEVLEAMAAGSADEADALLGASTFSAWPAQERARLARLVGPLVHHGSSGTRRAAWENLAIWRQWAPELSDLISPTIGDFASVSDWRRAVAQLDLLVNAGEVPGLLLEVVADLASRPVPPEMDAGPLRDSPSSQRLTAIADTAPRTDAGRSAFRDACAELLDQGFGIEATLFAVAAIDWSTPVEGLEHLHRILSDLDVGSATASRVLPRTMRAGTNRSQWSEVDLHPHAARFASTDDVGAILALALVAAAGPVQGWPEEWRSLLRVLRQHPDGWVRAGASRIFTHSE